MDRSVHAQVIAHPLAEVADVLVRIVPGRHEEVAADFEPDAAFLDGDHAVQDGLSLLGSAVRFRILLSGAKAMASGTGPP